MCACLEYERLTRCFGWIKDIRICLSPRAIHIAPHKTESQRDASGGREPRRVHRLFRHNIRISVCDSELNHSAMPQVDANRDGSIDWDEFKRAVSKPTTLEAWAQSVPLWQARRPRSPEPLSSYGVTWDVYGSDGRMSAPPCAGSNVRPHAGPAVTAPPCAESGLGSKAASLGFREQSCSL